MLYLQISYFDFHFLCKLRNLQLKSETCPCPEMPYFISSAVYAHTVSTYPVPGLKFTIFDDEIHHTGSKYFKQRSGTTAAFCCIEIVFLYYFKVRIFKSENINFNIVETLHAYLFTFELCKLPFNDRK